MQYSVWGPYRRSSWLQKFRFAPIPTLAALIYRRHQRTLKPPRSKHDLPIKVVCIADTHRKQPELPSGDLLVHAGDLTKKGTAAEIQEQLDWIDAQPFPHKVVIAGNHDELLDPVLDARVVGAAVLRRNLHWGSIHYLERSTASLIFPNGRSLFIHGDPATFKHKRGAFRHSSVDYWKGSVPLGTDVLVTHAPPKFHLDYSANGAWSLLEEVRSIKPLLHVCGHLHRDHGVDVIHHDDSEDLYIAAITKGAQLRDLWALWKRYRGASRADEKQVAKTILVNAAITSTSMQAPPNKPTVVWI